jgi:hypothetical protein
MTCMTFHAISFINFSNATLRPRLRRKEILHEVCIAPHFVNYAATPNTGTDTFELRCGNACGELLVVVAMSENETLPFRQVTRVSPVLSARLSWLSCGGAVILYCVPFSHEPTTHFLIRIVMSHPTASSSSNFQPIFDSALKAYERRTKKDLLAHPLAAQFQACDSPSSILAVLQQQVQELNRSQSGNNRLTKWLDPTVNILYALNATLGEGVGLVCSRI